MHRDSVAQQQAVMHQLLAAHKGLDKARDAVQSPTTLGDGPLLKLSFCEAHEVWSRRVAILEMKLEKLRSEEAGP